MSTEIMDPKQVEVERQMLEKHGQDVLLVMHMREKERLEAEIAEALKVYHRTQEDYKNAGAAVDVATQLQADAHFAKEMKAFSELIDKLGSKETVGVFAQAAMLLDKKVAVSLHIRRCNGSGSLHLAQVEQPYGAALECAVRRKDFCLKNTREAGETYAKLQSELSRLPSRKAHLEAQLALRRLESCPDGAALLKQMTRSADSRRLLK